MQLTFEGKTIDQLAVELIQAYSTDKPYQLRYSGGKDSDCILDLMQRAKVPYEAHYSVSPIDPPEVHSYIKREHPEVIWDYDAKGFFNIAVKKGLPTRQRRWCCEIIKELSGNNLDGLKVLGMRREESLKRSKYKCFMESIKHEWWLLPIVNWTESDVWQYISERQIKVNPLYKEGFRRIGCILCPFAGKDEIKLSLIKFPKIVNCWRLTADRVFKDRIDRGKPLAFKTSDDYFNWWIKR